MAPPDNEKGLPDNSAMGPFCAKMILLMYNLDIAYSKAKQGTLPLYISEYLDICDPVFTFGKLMEEVDLDRYLKKLLAHVTGRIRYNPVSMLKTVLFGFMSDGYISLRNHEDNCKVNMRYMYLMFTLRHLIGLLAISSIKSLLIP